MAEAQPGHAVPLADAGEYAADEAIAFVDIGAQYRRLKPVIDARIEAVLERGAFINGPEIDELERALAERANCAAAVGVSSGTDALVIALRGESIGAGDAVFVPTFTYMASANAVILAGATPVFVDVDEQTYMLDPADLARRIDHVRHDRRLRPRAVMAVDLFGLPADYPAIAAVAARHGMTVIADAAQSFGGRRDGRPVGSLAPITAVSFYPSKPLACYGDGGALFSDDAARAELWRSLRTHGTGDDRMQAQRVGMNARLDSIQAAVLLAKLTVFDDELAARERLARLYDARLDGEVVLPPRPANAESAWALYSILTENRDGVAAAMAAAGITTAVYYPHPLHRQPAYREQAPMAPLPVSEALSRRILSLPMHPYMGEDRAHRICDVLIYAIRRS